MYKVVLLATLLFSITCRVNSQNDSLRGLERVVRSVDRALDIRDAHVSSGYDTIYLKRAPERLRLTLQNNVSGSVVTIKGHTDDAKYKSSLETKVRYTLSIGASYRGITLSAAINPARMAGKNKDLEFNLNAYGNRFGADVIFQSANTLRGTIETNNTTTDINSGLVHQDMLYVNAYYVFNARRFSYPAAFSRSWVQQKSCGSFMLGTSFAGGSLRLKENTEITGGFSRISLANIGIGAGYGYNAVIKRMWLLHISSLPQIVVYSRCRTTVNGTREKSPYRFPNIIAVGRMAAVHHFDRYFCGITAVVNTLSLGDRDKLRLTTVKWRARMFFGIKL